MAVVPSISLLIALLALATAAKAGHDPSAIVLVVVVLIATRSI